MDGITYEDEECSYLETDPRIESVAGKVLVSLTATHFRLVDTSGDPIYWPLKNISHVEIGIVDVSWRHDEVFGIRFRVKDPEGVFGEGFQITIGCRNEYHAGVLAKRLAALNGQQLGKTDASRFQQEQQDNIPF